MSPIEVIIYTTHEVKDKYGTKEYHSSSKNFKVNGVEHSVDNGDVITEVIPYVNLLRMDISELNAPEFDFLQPVYLYQYKKYPRLIKSKKKNFQKDIDTIKENINKLKGGSSRAAKEIFVNLLTDITRILEGDRKKYKKELDNMEYLSDTYAGSLIAEGEEKGQLKFIINMLSDYTDEQIAKVSELSLEDVAKIREENMVRS